MQLSSENFISSFEENQLDFLKQTPFYNAKHIVVLSANIEEFDNTFQDFVHLEDIVLPFCIYEIPSFAFKGCESLKKVEMLSQISVIGDSAFEDCYSLETISFQMPSELSIGHLAFRKTMLNQMDLMNVKVSIGNFAFQMCKQLQSFRCKEILNIGYGVFFQCYSLSSVECDNLASLDLEFKQLNFLECEMK